MEVAQEVDEGHDWCNCSAEDDDGNTVHGEGCELRPAKFEVFRFSLDRLKVVEVTEDERTTVKYVVSMGYDETWPHAVSQYEEWFVKDLGSIASYIDSTRDKVVGWLCSEDVKDRASAYKAIGDYHGFRNLDDYPLDLTEAEINTRWER